MGSGRCRIRPSVEALCYGVNSSRNDVYELNADRSGISVKSGEAAFRADIAVQILAFEVKSTQDATFSLGPYSIATVRRFVPGFVHFNGTIGTGRHTRSHSVKFK